MRSRLGSDLGRGVKRILDLIVSAVALVLLTLPFAALATAIKLNDRGPVFFRQERVGIGRRHFRV